MLAAKTALDEITEAAQRLAPAPVTAVTHAASGGNSRIYKVETGQGAFALKHYPPAAADGRDRLGVETAAIAFFNTHKVAQVPRTYGSDGRFALYSWIEGAVPGDVTRADIDAACKFIAHLRDLSKLPEAANFISASEACFSLGDISRQIASRVERLNEVAGTEPALAEFLNRFDALWKQREALARAAHADTALTQTQRCLIPADFGFHNVLKDEGGQLGFLDFEYFGWDDPVKLAADTLLHPGHVLSDDVLAYFYRALQATFRADDAFAARLRAFLPLFALRWALILCNEFLREKRANRAFVAGHGTEDKALWEQKKQHQLAKAERMLHHPILAVADAAE